MNRDHAKPGATEKAPPPHPDGYLLVVQRTAQAFWMNHAFRLAAAMSYYTVLSIAPLLLLFLSLVGTRLDRDTVGRQLVTDVRSLAGVHAADVTQTIVEYAAMPPPSRTTMALGLGMLIFGASGMFTQLQDSLNLIWDVPNPVGRGVWRYVRGRLIALAMVMAVGFIMLVTPLATAAVTVINAQLVSRVPQIAQIWQFLHFIASNLVITLIFATIFKAIPHTKVRWNDVWIGAAATALMFTCGQFLFGFYLGYSSLGAAYGAAGSLIVLLVWVYCSALIVFLGAQFTKVYAMYFGSQSRRLGAHAHAAGGKKGRGRRRTGHGASRRKQ